MQATDPPRPPAPTARERILLTAHDLFYRDGIRATGIDRIIAASGVTKVTFYRHFPSKNDLILAFLEYRHTRWKTWFLDALTRHGGDIDALVPALTEWLRDTDFRGCAFINSLEEMGGTLPEVVTVVRRHKLELESIVADLLPPSPRQKEDAEAIALAIDGAIIRAQWDSPDAASRGLARVIEGLW